MVCSVKYSGILVNPACPVYKAEGKLHWFVHRLGLYLLLFHAASRNRSDQQQKTASLRVLWAVTIIDTGLLIE